MAKRRRRNWTPAEIADLVRSYPTERTEAIAKRLGRKRSHVHHKASLLGLKKDRACVADWAREASARPDHGGRKTRWTKGHRTWNTGLKGWDAGGRSHETRFVKGQRGINVAPIGSERLVGGYLQRKMTDTGYPPRDWVPVHRLLWESVHGPIPPGHALAFRDRDKTHIAIDNLELVTRAELMRRNTYHRYPKDIALAIQARGALIRKINRIEREQREDRNQ